MVYRPVAGWAFTLDGIPCSGKPPRGMTVKPGLAFRLVPLGVGFHESGKRADGIRVRGVSDDIAHLMRIRRGIEQHRPDIGKRAIEVVRRRKVHGPTVRERRASCRRTARARSVVRHPRPPRLLAGQPLRRGAVPT